MARRDYSILYKARLLRILRAAPAEAKLRRAAKAALEASLDTGECGHPAVCRCDYHREARLAQREQDELMGYCPGGYLQGDTFNYYPR